MKPFVKWAGGKRQILNRINEFIKDSLTVDNNEFTYIEPFLGGGAVFFDFAPKNAIINDLNSDLINAYKIIQSDKYQDLIKRLQEYSLFYKEDPDGFYYDTRSLDRDDKWLNNASNIEKAARMIFLNKTCYNGLYRVNKKGQFNTPIGRYKNPTICDEKNINEIHKYLSDSTNSITIMNSSYEEAIRKCKDGDIIYIDPPYDYEDDDGFTKYQMAGFTFEDFIKLKHECDLAISKGAFVILSNNATSKVIELFQQDPNYKIYYDENYFNTLRNINCLGNSRKTGREVIIWGMPSNIPLPQANDINKVIKLAMADESILSDKNKALELLEVGSTRQVAYYYSALMYFKFITHDKKFTDKLNNIKSDENLVKMTMFEYLKKDDLFKSILKKYKNKKEISSKDISLVLSEKYSELSVSTISRRASTIKNWIDWIRKIENDLNQINLF